jgi:hypothetical protein
MPYPPDYPVTTDFAQAATDQVPVDPIDLAQELEDIATSVNEAIAFIKAITTADKRLKPASLLASTLVESTTITATAAQTVFPHGWDDVDAVTNYARAYADGVLIRPSLVTLDATNVTLPAQAAGVVVVLELFQDGASVLAKLADNANALGASLVAIEDAGALYAAANVEAALAEVMTKIDGLITSIGSLGDYLLADGSVAMTDDFDAGANQLKNVEDGTDAQDAVTMAQFQAVVTALAGLSTTYLALTGGTMSGPLSMGNNLITDVAPGSASTDAVNKAQLDTAAAEFAEKIDRRGIKLSGVGVFTGPVGLGSSATDTADANQTAAPDAVVVHTIYGVPLPAADGHVANKKYVDDQVLTAASTVENLSTAEIDTTKSLRPDGAGGVGWVEDAVTIPPTRYQTGMTRSSNGVLGSTSAGTATINEGGIAYASGTFTVPSAGNYLVSAAVDLENGTNETATIQRNGSNVSGNAAQASASSTGESVKRIVLPLRCAANDTIRVNLTSVGISDSVTGAVSVTKVG